MPFRRCSRAQGYIEFGLGLAVAALVAVIGLDQMRGAIYAYFTGDPTKNMNGPPPPPPPPPPPQATEIDFTCPPGPIDLATVYTCTVKVKNLDVPANTPTGTVFAVTNATSGDFGVGAVQPSCTLGAPFPPGQCNLTYVATHSGLPVTDSPYTLRSHTIGVTYNPPPGPFQAAAPKFASIMVKRNAEVTLSTNWSSSTDFPQCTANPLVVGFVNTSTCTGYAKEFGETVAFSRWPQGTLTWNIVGGSISPNTCTLAPYLLEQSASFCAVDITTFLVGLGSHQIGQVTFTPGAGSYHSGPFGLSHGIAGAKPLQVSEGTTTAVTGCSSFSTTVGVDVTCDVLVTNVSSARKPFGKVVWSTTLPTYGTFVDDATGTPGYCQLVPVVGPPQGTCRIRYHPLLNTPPNHPLLARFQDQIGNPQNDFLISDSSGTPITITVT